MKNLNKMGLPAILGAGFITSMIKRYMSISDFQAAMVYSTILFVFVLMIRNEDRHHVDLWIDHLKDDISTIYKNLFLK